MNLVDSIANVPAHPRIQFPMDIEQLAPKKPNFLLILILFCASLLVIFLLAWLFLGFDGRHLTFRHRHGYRHPTSRLVLPADPAPANLDGIHNPLKELSS